MKGPAKAVRVAATQRRERRSLSRWVENALFQFVEVMCEGELRQEGHQSFWFGSTMLTFDLHKASTALRQLDAPRSLETFAHLVDGSVRMKLRAARIARAEVSRRFPDRVLGTAQLETRVRLEGKKLHMDIDLDVPIVVSSRVHRR